MSSLVIAFIFSAILFFKEKFGYLGFFYLISLPFVVFSRQNSLFLSVSLLIGISLYYLFKKPALHSFLIFLIIFLLSIVIIKPKLGLDMGLLNSINAQRGEHANFETNLMARLIHNKTELVHSFISNFDKLLSPTAIFASGFWHRLSPYYPLGFLLPWDIYFLYLFFRYGKIQASDKRIYLFIPSVAILLLVTGITYIDQAIFFAFGVLYFLAIIAASGYSSISKNTKVIFFFLNTIFLLYQLAITPYFKI